MSRTIKENRIFDAALKLFAEYGYKKTTIEDVANELGMTPGNIYFYVKNKKDLYEKTVQSALGRWRDSVAEAVAAETGAPEKFRVMAERSFEYLRGRDDILSVLSRDPDIFTLTPGEDRFYDINAGAMLLMKDILQQGVREKSFHKMNVDRATEFLFSVYIMFLIRAYVKPEGENVAEMFREGLEMILRGLRR
ncbi:MAG: TetR/AcrR family transcriptional regulator [Spirochaetes bacterium]|jgi:AcrR family transcriptional regulator|nr:TetR/AcrR family transcriptional regulator [Spirochaetota bacterium]